MRYVGVIEAKGDNPWEVSYYIHGLRGNDCPGFPPTLHLGPLEENLLQSPRSSRSSIMDLQEAHGGEWRGGHFVLRGRSG